jgi:hypothetical protein
MNQWGEENEYERALAKSKRRNARMAKYREKKQEGAEQQPTEERHEREDAQATP